MQRLGDGTWVVSASDLTKLAACPWLVARDADSKLGKNVWVPDVDDPMMELVAKLGLAHEQRTLAALRSTLAQVVEIEYDRLASPEDPRAWRDEITKARELTLQALSSGADAVFQAALYQEAIDEAPIAVGFQGFADFLVHSEAGWEVWDTKLARSAKDSALVQLAAYVDQLRHAGVSVSAEVRLVLGDGTHSIHNVDGLLPAYYSQRSALIALLHQRERDPEPTPWQDERYVACGTSGCPACSEQIPLHDDLFGIAGLRKTQRAKLLLAGFPTIADFARASRNEVRERVFGIGRDTLQALHLQASLQVASRHRSDGRPAWEIRSAGILNRIPPADPGDIFFDFEGDPTYQEFDSAGRALGSLAHGDDTVWFGIEYLFGLWGQGLQGSAGRDFVPIWAENFDEERQALQRFCRLVLEQYERHPQMRIYHYASYERTKLSQLTQRHRVCADEVSFILEHLLLDLYPVVMKGVAVGLPSYSLKSLEELYFEPGTRTGIAGGGESVMAFSNYVDARDRGDAEQAEDLKASILHYNRIDCVSTQALRDWLVAIRDHSHPSST